MNGATLFGIALALFALNFAIELSKGKQIIFISIAYFYLFASLLALFIPSLSD